MIDTCRDVSEQNGIELIAPDSFDTSHWSCENDGFDFMQKTAAEFSAAQDLTALPIYGFGHSAGAMMITHLSIRHGAYFKAVGAHAGSPSAENLRGYERHKAKRAPLTHI